MPLSVNLSGRSHVGRVRSRNEDSMEMAPEAGVGLVADGMGGHPGGDVASRVAAEAAAETLLGWVEGRPDERDGTLDDALARCVREAHRAVRAEGGRHPELQGMGTTLTALVVDRGAARWGVGHAGDSRAYLFREGGLERITRDDTWVQAQVEEGLLSPEEARHHPASHMLRQCVGLEQPPEPRRYTGEARDGDRFLLCSDGLTDMLEDGEIQEILAGGADPDAAVERLVEAALERGGVDNVTVVVADVADDGG